MKTTHTNMPRHRGTAALTALALCITLPSALQAQSSSSSSGVRPAPGTSNAASSSMPSVSNSGSPSSSQAATTTTTPSSSATVDNRYNTTSASATASTTAASSREAKQEQRFLMRAHALNQREIQLAQLASTKASSPEVRAYAQELLKAHQQTEGDMKPVLASVGLDSSMLLSPTGRVTNSDGKPANASLRDRWNAMMSDRQQKKLADKTGADFDKAFVEQMIDEHENAIDLFEDAAEDHAGQVQAFASQTLPHLRAHLAQAEQLEKTLK